MFTGIIETVGEVQAVWQKGTNFEVQVKSDISSQLKVDQSVSHNGVCLTVVEVVSSTHKIVAVEETLIKSNLDALREGDRLNLERCMIANGRFDGHIVQGHVDAVGKCKEIIQRDGSWYFQFEFEPGSSAVLVEKGSICVNGISLTCFDVTATSFRVAIIPYTYEHTNMHAIAVGDSVNLEFDIIGKYVQKLLGSGIRG